MASCKDCLHYEVCADSAEKFIDVFTSGMELSAACLNFKDRTKWAEKKLGKWGKNHPNDNIVYCDQCYMPQDMPTSFCHSCGAEMVQE